MYSAIHRAGLAIATLALVTVVGGFFIVDGYLGALGQATAGPVSAMVQGPLPATPATAPPEVVYVRPAPPAAVIHVTRKAPQAPPHIVHVTVPGAGGASDGEGGSEGQGGGD